MPVLNGTKSDYDVIVIGAGIIGATIFRRLTLQGRKGLLLDDNRSDAGTKPSGGHLKPSWFGDMKKTDYEPAMKTLDDIWGLHQSDFLVWPTKISTTVYRVDTDQVVNARKTVGTVTDLHNLFSSPVVTYDTMLKKEIKVSTDLLIIAAGVWCSKFFPGIQITPKRGVSFRYTGKLKHEFIKPWAPFKQIVAHQQDVNEIWVGDGSAILDKNWTKERTEQCNKRCFDALGKSGNLLHTSTGLRPYCDSGKDPCLLKQMNKNVWVVTGAGKSGTIAAGWAANRLTDATN